MSDVVRRAQLILDFVAGDTDINTSEFDKLIALREEEKKAAEEAGAASEKARQDEIDKLKQLEQAIKEQTDTKREEIDKAREAERTAADQRIDDFTRIAGAAQSTTEGVLLLTRAVTLFAAKDEDIQVILEKLILVQAAIDGMRGSILLVQGLAASMGTLRVAATATLAALGPVGVGVVAVGAAVSAASLAYGAFTEDVDENTEAMNKNLEALGLVRQAQDEVRSGREEAFGALSDLLDDQTLLRQHESERLRSLSRTSRRQAASGRTAADFSPFGLAQQELGEREIIEQARVVRDLIGRELQRPENQAERIGQQLERAIKTDEGDPFNVSISPDEARLQEELTSAQARTAELNAELERTLQTVRDSLIVLVDEFDRIQTGAATR